MSATRAVTCLRKCEDWYGLRTCEYVGSMLGPRSGRNKIKANEFETNAQASFIPLAPDADTKTRQWLCRASRQVGGCHAEGLRAHRRIHDLRRIFGEAVFNDSRQLCAPKKAKRHVDIHTTQIHAVQLQEAFGRAPNPQLRTSRAFLHGYFGRGCLD